MNARRYWIGLLAVAGVAPASSARALMVEHAIDKTHSSIVFKVLHQNLTHIFGRMEDFSGTISIDHPRKPKEIAMDVELNASSVDTANRKRDRHLRGREFFNTTRYKKIRFKSKSCKALEQEGHYEITGDLTLLGTTKEITIVFHLTGITRGKDGSNRLGGESTFTVKRSEYGMDKMLEGIGDEVTVMVSVQAVAKQLPSG